VVKPGIDVTKRKTLDQFTARSQGKRVKYALKELGDLRAGGAEKGTMRLFSRSPGINEIPVRPEESVALRRLSQSSDEQDDLSSFANDDDYLHGDIGGDIYAADIDGGREAWKMLLGAWLVDFMTSGKGSVKSNCIHLLTYSQAS
jgi:hypothetical protein